jgi:hypothetical protein
MDTPEPFCSCLRRIVEHILHVEFMLSATEFPSRSLPAECKYDAERLKVEVEPKIVKRPSSRLKRT